MFHLIPESLTQPTKHTFWYINHTYSSYLRIYISFSGYHATQHKIKRRCLKQACEVRQQRGLGTFQQFPHRINSFPANNREVIHFEAANGRIFGACARHFVTFVRLADVAYEVFIILQWTHNKPEVISKPRNIKHKHIHGDTSLLVK